MRNFVTVRYVLPMVGLLSAMGIAACSDDDDDDPGAGGLAQERVVLAQERVVLTQERVVLQVVPV